MYLDRDGPIYCWDLATGRLGRSPWYPPVASWYQLLTSAGRVLVQQCRDDRARLFDLDTGQQLGGTLTITGMATTKVPHELCVGMALSPHGTTLVPVGTDATVRVWGLKNLLGQAQRIQTNGPSYLPPPTSRADTEPVVELAPGGSRAFFGHGDQGQVIDTRTGRPVGPVVRHALLHQAHFSPDGAYLATATSASPRDEPPIVRIWDLRGREPIVYESPKYIHGLGFSADSRRLAVACVGQTAILDVRTGTTLQTLREPSCAVNAAFSPDGRLLAVAYRGGWPGSGAGLRMWDLETGQPAGKFHRFGPQNGIAAMVEFVARGQTLLALNSSINELQQLDALPSGGIARGVAASLPNLMAAHPAHDLVATANSGGTLEVWSVSDGQRRWAASCSGEVSRLKLSPDGKTAAVVGTDRNLRLWDFETGWALGPALVHPDDVADLAFAADRQALVTATRAGQVFRWSLPEPMTGGLADCTLAVQRKLGIAMRSGMPVLLSPGEWRDLAGKARK